MRVKSADAFYSEMGLVTQAMLDNQVLTADQLIQVLLLCSPLLSLCPPCASSPPLPLPTLTTRDLLIQ